MAWLAAAAVVAAVAVAVLLLPAAELQWAGSAHP